MTTSRRNLVEALRAELAAIEPARPCCWRAESDGLGAAATGRARSPSVARLAARLSARSATRRPAAEHGPIAGSTFEWDGAAEHCRTAWLRGMFLARGSLSLAIGTHLELVMSPAEARQLSRRLAHDGIPQSWRVRRGHGVITWKGREHVLAFLRRLGASAAGLELESQAVARTLHGHLNRVLNAEHANVRRSVEAATRNLAAIELLAETGQLARMRAFDREVAALRQAEPSQTISDLAERLGVGRARVQRALQRLESAADRALRPAGMG